MRLGTFGRCVIAACCALFLALPAAAQTSAPFFTHGVACGEPTSTDVVLWTRTATAASLTPELLDDGGAVQQALPAVRTSAETDFTVKTLATGLAPATSLHYRFRGPNGELSPTGTCHTAPSADQSVPLTFAFSGDVDWKWRPYPVLHALNKEALDFFIFLGDTIYESTNLQGTEVAEDLATYRAKYRQNRELPDGVPDGPVPLRDLFASFGMFSVPDNHELGTSVSDPAAPRYTEGGAPAAPGADQTVNHTPGFDDRMRAYLEYQPLRDRLASDTGDPRVDGTRRLYFSQPWGKSARLIVVDDRSYRDIRLPNSDDPRADDPNRTMLGAPQLRWLEDELRMAQSEGVTWKFVVISSPIQHIGRPSEVGADLDGTKSWEGGYRVERDRLLKFVDDQGIDNVVFLTTDNHNTMINNLRYRATPEDPSSPLVPARNAFEIITGPLGAGFGYPAVKADLAGLSGRDAERRVAQTLVGDVPNTDGELRGQRQGGVDPIGLEPSMGLIPDSVMAEGGPDGVAEPAAFASFNTFTYAVLSVQDSVLTVRVVGHPGAEFPVLLVPAVLADYSNTPSHTILQFKVQGA
jgi:phosphodiesterase/alkaline phosphatase D-like protein